MRSRVVYQSRFKFLKIQRYYVTYLAGRTDHSLSKAAVVASTSTDQSETGESECTVFPVACSLLLIRSVAALVSAEPPSLTPRAVHVSFRKELAWGVWGTSVSLGCLD